MLLELEDEALSMLFPSPSVEQTTASFIIKRDSYTRAHAEKVPRELSLALLKKHHSLWGEFIYNAARVMSDRIDNGEIKVSGQRVLELGAGAGLPGIIAALNGASHTVISDYADEDLIRVIELNIKEHCTDRQNVAACGFTFGENPQELLLLGGESRFDVVLMADLLFNRSEHEKLLRTLHQVLVPVTGEAWCIFSHHDPLKAPQDLNFFERAERDFGFSVTRVGEEIRQSYPFVQKDGLDGRRGVVNIYRLSLLPPAAT